MTVGKNETDGVAEFFTKLQVWGTPEQCVEKILDIRSRVGCDTFVRVFSYAGMPGEEAERSMRLFAAEVMPELQRLEWHAATSSATVAAASPH